MSTLESQYQMRNISGSSQEPGKHLAGTLSVARHILRLDRKRIAIWIASMAFFIVYFTIALSNVFDEAALASRAEVMRTPAGIVMGGPGYGLENYTPAVAIANEGSTWFVLALALMSIFHVIRHTREKEENGLAELVRANPVSRQAASIATLITLGGMLLTIAIVTALAMVAAGEGISLVDALVMMIGVAIVAMVFGTVALGISQITASSRTATGVSVAVFGLAFLVRAAGDLQQQGGSTLSWFSPIAWTQQTRAFVDLRWWPLLLALLTAVVLTAVALKLETLRDFGEGLIAAKPGRAEASPMLRSPIALAWIQQRGGLFWTTLGLGAVWFGTGTMMSTLDQLAVDLVESTPALEAMFGADPAMFTKAFLDLMMMFAAICCAAYAVSSGLRARAEERSGRLELVLASPISRTRWLLAQLLVSAIGTTLLLAASVACMWAGANLVGVIDPGPYDYFLALTGYLPGVWFFLALTFALFAWTPRLLSVPWLLLMFAFVVGMFGDLLELPVRIKSISPLYWTSTVFSGGLHATETGVLSLTVILLVSGSLVGIQRRQMSSA